MKGGDEGERIWKCVDGLHIHIGTRTMKHLIIALSGMGRRVCFGWGRWKGAF
jgi:hypothetical protein